MSSNALAFPLGGDAALLLGRAQGHPSAYRVVWRRASSPSRLERTFGSALDATAFFHRQLLNRKAGRLVDLRLEERADDGAWVVRSGLAPSSRLAGLRDMERRLAR